MKRADFIRSRDSGATIMFDLITFRVYSVLIIFRYISTPWDPKLWRYIFWWYEKTVFK